MEHIAELKKTAVGFVGEYMDFLEHFSDERVVNPISEVQLEKVRQKEISKDGKPLEDVVREMREDIFPYGYQNYHPRFFGFIPGTASPLSWLGDIMTTAYNRHAGCADTQPAMWQIEQRLIRWLNDQVGFPKQAGGCFVSGGSMANLTAVTVARNSRLPEEDWYRGVAYVSDQTHSSVAKGLRIIGMEQKRIRQIPTDKHFRMKTDLLREAIQQDQEAGLKPFLVIATAGTTNTGSVDPLCDIRKICDEYGLWMHIDGAFGASVVLAKKQKQVLAGIEAADSLSWDAHKWLFQTQGCGMVLVRDQNRLLQSFSVHPEYLKDLEKDSSLINPWDLSIELTRPSRCMKLWLTLQVMGSDRISESIDHGFEAIQWAKEAIRRNPDIEILSAEQLPVLNFRYNPAGYSEGQKAELNLRISEMVVESGYAGIFTTELNGKKVLRMCTLHPEVTKEDVLNTVRLMEQYYRELVDTAL